MITKEIKYCEIKNFLDYTSDEEIWIWRETGEKVVLRQHEDKDKVIVEFSNGLE